MFGGKVLSYLIKAKDLTGTALASARNGISGFADRVKSLSKGIGANMMNIYAAFKIAGAGIKLICGTMASAIKAAFNFETTKTQFEVLLGSMDAATDRVKDLADLAAHTPFTFDQLAVASRKLHVFTNGVLGGTDSLKKLGDASAATGAPIDELATWIGRAYSSISSGKPFGEAAMRLQELGIISPDVRSEMENLQKSGADVSDVWKVLEDRLETFKGGMEKLSTTGDGMVSTLKDNWGAAVRTFGDQFSEAAKGGIKQLSDALTRLVEDGTIEEWATKTYNAFKKVYDICRDVKNIFMSIWNAAGKIDAALGDFIEDKTGMQVGFSSRGKAQGEAEDWEKATKAAQKRVDANDARLSREKAERDNKAVKIDEANKVASAQRVAAEQAKADKAAQKEKEKQAKETAKKFKKTASGFFKFLGDLRKDAQKQRDKEAKEREKKEKEEAKKKKEEELKELRAHEKALQDARDKIQKRRGDRGKDWSPDDSFEDFHARRNADRQKKRDNDKFEKKARRRLEQLKAKEKRLRKGRGKLGGKMSDKDIAEMKDLEQWLKNRKQEPEDVKQLKELNKKIEDHNKKLDEALTCK